MKVLSKYEEVVSRAGRELEHEDTLRWGLDYSELRRILNIGQFGLVFMACSHVSSASRYRTSSTLRASRFMRVCIRSSIACRGKESAESYRMLEVHSLASTSGACTLVRTPPTIRLPARFPMPVSIHSHRQFPVTMLSLNTLTKMAKALKVTVA